MAGVKQMKYYFDPDCGIRAFESDGSQDFLITDSMRPLTPEEISSHCNPVLTYEQQMDQVERNRKAAYANPYTGSDRYFAEAVRLEGMGQPAEAETARMRGIVRFQEIQAQYPWPAEPEPIVTLLD